MPGGPFPGLTHQTLSALGGSPDSALWRHQMAEKVVVPPHYHAADETVVVLTGCLRFHVGVAAADYEAGTDPYVDEVVVDCGPEATIIVPRGTIHGYEIVATPADVLIFMADPKGQTFLPGGDVMRLPWNG